MIIGGNVSLFTPVFTLSIADWIFLIDTFLKPCEKSTNIHTAELNIYVVPSFAYSLRLADSNFVYHISTIHSVWEHIRNM